MTEGSSPSLGAPSLSQVSHVHIRGLAQVHLAHCPVAVDSPLQPPNPFVVLITLDVVENLLATGAQGLWCDILLSEVFVPHCHWLRHVRLLK